MSVIHVNFIVNSEEYPDLYKYILGLSSNKAPVYRALMNEGYIFRRLLSSGLKFSSQNTNNIENDKIIDKLKNNFL